MHLELQEIYLISSFRFSLTICNKNNNCKWFTVSDAIFLGNRQFLYHRFSSIGIFPMCSWTFWYIIKTIDFIYELKHSYWELEGFICDEIIFLYVWCFLFKKYFRDNKNANNMRWRTVTFMKAFFQRYIIFFAYENPQSWLMILHSLKYLMT